MPFPLNPFTNTKVTWEASFFFRIFIKLINCVFIFLIPKAVSSTRGAGYPIVRAHVLYMGQESGLFSCFNKVLLISWYC